MTEMTYNDGVEFVEGVKALLAEVDAIQVARIFEASGLLDDPEWDNVPLHCLRVAQVCDEIGLLTELEDFSDDDLRVAVIAGLLHDVRKKREKERVAELVAGGMEKSAAFTQAQAEQKEWLQGFGDQFAEPVRVSALSGHASLAYFLEADRPMAEIVFHLADDLCGGEKGDEVVMLAERIAALKERYPWLETEHPAELGGQSWIEVQQGVSAAILDKLALLSGYASGEELNQALVDKFASRN